MDKETFLKMPPAIRVKEVNKLLKKYDLKEISKMIGIPSSTFSKVMREGDYLYHQGDKQYYPFVRSEEERISKDLNHSNEEIKFIRNNRDILEKIIHNIEIQGLLYLDKRIYDKNAKFVNKSIRMNSEIYEDFSHFCDEYFPHLKMQDLIAQALIDAMQRYKPQN